MTDSPGQARIPFLRNLPGKIMEKIEQSMVVSLLKNDIAAFSGSQRFTPSQNVDSKSLQTGRVRDISAFIGSLGGYRSLNDWLNRIIVRVALATPRLSVFPTILNELHYGRSRSVI